MKFNQTFSVLFWQFRKKENKQGLVPIYARITVGGARAECSVRRNVDPLHWDSEKEKAKDTFLEAPLLNEYLALVRAEIIKHTDFYGWRAGWLACLPYRALMKKFDDLV